MVWGSRLGAAAIAAAMVLLPAQVYAASVFDQNLMRAHDFALFPFWQNVVTDVAPKRPAVVPATWQTPGTIETGSAAASMVVPASLPLVPQALPPGSATSDCSDVRTCAPQVWLSFLDGLRGRTPWEQLQAVNGWANAKPYVPDWVNWHVPDYWETPGEFVAYGGDCEDYAITKYFSLVRLGFAPDDLRIVVTNDTRKRVFHAVLAARMNGRVWLLDNESPQIVDMDTATQYVPVYSLNQNGWWLHSNPTIYIAGTTITAAPLTATNGQAGPQTVIDTAAVNTPMAPPPAATDQADPQTVIVTAAVNTPAASPAATNDQSGHQTAIVTAAVDTSTASSQLLR